MLAALYRHACEEATGALESARGTVFLRRGYVRAVLLRQADDPAAARIGDLLRARMGPGAAAKALRVAARAGSSPVGRAVVEAGLADRADVEQALKRQTALRLAALVSARSPVGFHAGAQPPADKIVLPFDPLPWLREHLDARLSSGLDERVRVRALPEPPARLLRRGEAGFARALGAGARPCDLGAEARPLVAFLAAVDALYPAPAQVSDARRALRRQLAALHPDAHPHASPAERARLCARFQRVADAYRRLERS
ncbi:MAG TPA: hypothetical protein VKN99_15315 [Polyangia bacterium]|nr:hypothetical protein [Polyangia bacterium]